MADAAPQAPMPDDQVRSDFLAARAAAPGLSAEQQLDALLAAPPGRTPTSAGGAPGTPGTAGAATPSAAPAEAAGDALPFGRKMDEVAASLAAGDAETGPSLLGKLVKGYFDWWQKGGEAVAKQNQEIAAMHAQIAALPPDQQGAALIRALLDPNNPLVKLGTQIGMSVAPGEGAKGTLETLGIPPPPKPLVGVPGGDVIARAQAESQAAGAAAEAAGEQAGAAAVPPARGAEPAPAPAPAPAAPAVTLVQPDGTAKPFPLGQGTPIEVTPAIRAQAKDWINGVTGDNPVQASLAQIQDPKVMAQAVEGVASFLPRAALKPDEVLRRAAYDTAMQPEDVLAGLKGRLPSDQQIAAWSMLVNSGAEQLGKAAQTAIESGAPGDWEEFTRAYALQNHVLGEWTGAGTEMGRAFRARQLASEARSDYAQTVQQIIENVGPGNVEDAARKLAALKTPDQISGLTAAWRWATSRDGMLTTWYNFLLGPKTVVKKGLTDLTMPFWNVAERAIAEKAGSGAVPAGEAFQLLRGYAGAFGDAVRAGGQGLLAGRSQFMAEARTLEGLARTRTSLLANGGEMAAEGAAAAQPTRNALAYLRAALPTSWIAGIDDFAKTFHYRAELRALAWREASGKLLDAAGAVDGEARAQFVQDMLANPSPELHMQALQQAQRLTFTEPLTGIAQKFADAVDGANLPVPGTRFELPVGRIVVPFARTPTNFVRFLYRSSPVAAVFKSPALREELAAGGAGRDLAYARMGLGTGLALSTVAAWAQGLFTGRGPSDPRLREAWMAAGNRPYSIQLPGARPVAFPVEPFAMTMGAIADTLDLMKFAKQEDSDQLALSLALGAGHAFLSRTYMQGLAEFMDAIQNPDMSGARYADRLVASLTVPRAVADTAAALDGWQRAHYSALQAIEANLPFLRQDLPLARDRWGDPIPIRDGYAHIVSPFTPGPKPGETNPIDRWRWAHRDAFANGDAEIPKLRMVQSWQQGQGVKANVRLTPEQYDRLQLLAGNGLRDPRTGLGAKDTLNALVQGKGPAPLQAQWDRSSDAERALMLQQIVGDFRRGARVQLTREYPDIRDAVQAQWGQRRGQLAQPPAPAAPAAPGPVRAPTLE